MGSTRGILGESKAVLAKYSYLPYGQLNIGGGLPLNTGFTGHHWDAETGMYFAPFRHYMPGSGRWLSRDPLGFIDGPNTYGYVASRPTSLVDPLGLSLRDICGTVHPHKPGEITLSPVPYYNPYASPYRDPQFEQAVDDISRWVGNNVGGPSLLLLLSLTLGRLVGSPLVLAGSEYASIEATYPTLTRSAGEWGLLLTWIEGVFDIADMPFEWWTTLMMGEPETDACSF